MKAVVEPLEGNKVKLSIEVDEPEFERAVNAAYRKIAKEVRVPGFRPGKAPRRILEARLGAGTGRSEALREALPEYYARAVADNEVDAIAAPEIDITAGQDAGPVAFAAVVEVRPQITVDGYASLRVEVPSPLVGEDDITEQIDRMRGNFGELAVADRPAKQGDHVTIDLHGERDGEVIGAMTTDDFVYEVGSDSVLPELDAQLDGAKVGDILAFDTDMPDGAVAVRVLVKEVKEKVLPDVTDEWAADASEFDTVAELRADLVTRMEMVKRMQSSMALRNGTVEALVALVTDEPPKALVDSEVERRAHDLGHRLEAQGATIAQYLQVTGQSEQDVLAELRAGAEPAVKADLALRAVASAEELSPTADELDAELGRLAQSYQLSLEDFRAQVQTAGQMPAVRSDLEKGKAVEWLVEHAEVVDPEGNPVDRALLEPPAELTPPTDTEPAVEPEDTHDGQGDDAPSETGEV